MTREEIQKIPLDLIKTSNNILLEWCTGLGKSLAAIKVQEFIKATNTILIVSETAHIKNWQDEYKKHNKNNLLESTNIFCYASLKKNVNLECDLLILDEVHNSTSDLRLDCLSTIKAKKVVMLSATVDKETLTILGNIFTKLIKHKVTTKQAIEWGILPNPIYYLIPLELNKKDVNTSFVVSRGLKNKRVKINSTYKDMWTILKNKSYKDLELTVSCTEVEKNNYINSQMDYYKRMYMSTRNEFLMTKWLRIGSERKKFLGESKTNKLKQLLSSGWCKDKRYICFCSNIEQANILGNDSTSINSKKVSKHNTSIIDNFNTGKIDNIFTVGMLQEGQNLNNIDACILVQLDSGIRPFIQKSGRAFRSKKPIIYIFYYKDTHDEVIIKKILEEVDENNIKILKL